MHPMWMCPADIKGIGGGKEMEKEKKGRGKKIRQLLPLISGIPTVGVRRAER